MNLTFLSCFALCRTRSSAWDVSCFRLCVRDMLCSSEFLLTQALLSAVSFPLPHRSTSEISGSFDCFCDYGLLRLPNAVHRGLGVWRLRLMRAVTVRLPGLSLQSPTGTPLRTTNRAALPSPP